MSNTSDNIALSSIIGLTVAGTIGIAYLSNQWVKRTEPLEKATAAACDSAVAQTYKDPYIRQACKDAFNGIVRSTRSFGSSKKTENFNILEMDKADYQRFGASLKQEAFDRAVKENVDRRNFIRAEYKLEQAIKNIKVDGAKIYENALVDVSFESITSFKNAKQQDVVTGKWSVVVSDANSNATRTFLYDYATGKATGPSGTSSGESDFWFRYNKKDAAGSSSSSMVHTGDLQDCSKVTSEISCSVAQAIHDVLNSSNPESAMTKSELESYIGAIKEQYMASGGDENSNYKVRLLNFAVGKVQRKGEGFAYSWN